MACLIERDRNTDRITRRTVFVRPLGGGHEWETPLGSLTAVE